ncbi:MAG: hypothetical protein IBX52_06225 [Bacterioplanes sp.]|nr:hypothetical protein [Bacterioplanes sp.]
MACFQYQRRGVGRFSLAIVLFGLTAMAWSTPNETLRLLQGQATYYYEVNRYNNALASIAQWRDHAHQQALTLPEQQWSMKLLEASIYLSLGIEQHAESIMIDAQVASVDNLGHAWFLLSRRWQQRGDWERAIKTAQLALAPRNQLPSQWHSEAQFIQALSYAQQLQLEPLAHVVTGMPVRDIWTAYARYNWVLALIESYTPSHQIQQVVAETLHYMGDSDEFQQLRQRLLLVASIEALEANNTRLAEQHLTLITQDSPYAAAALLQYSWTSLAQQQWTQALHSLRALQQQHHEFHPAVMESYLLVPYALEQMRATGQAIRAYEQVEQRLLSMQTHIQQARQQIESNNWLQPWLTEVSNEPLWGWRATPVSVAPEGDLSRLLHGLIEQNSFEVGLQEALDLQRAVQQVEQQLHNIPLWQDLIVRRQQHAKSVQGNQQMVGLQRRFEAAQGLVAERHVDLQQQAREAFAYTSAEEAQALQMQQRILRRIQVLQQRGYIAGPALTDYQERWRRIRGLQLWHNNHLLPERRWRAVQAWQGLQLAETQLQRQRQHTDMALRWMQGDWQDLSGRLQQQQEIGQQLRQRLIRLQQQQQTLLEQRVSQHLYELDQRVLDYLAQTRLAIARLYDDALQRQLERQQQEVDRDDA